jgi:hypothetical protein
MSRIHKLTRLASLIAAAPALLLGALSAQAQSPAGAAPAEKPAAANTPTSQTAKVATFIKICCLNLVGYNRKGETLLTAQDGQPFTINEAGQRIRIKVTQNDIANAAPIKGVSGDASARAKHITGDITARAKHITGDVSATAKSDDLFLKFTTPHNNIEVVGVNAQKQNVFKNQRGETFTINPATGDMVFVK